MSRFSWAGDRRHLLQTHSALAGGGVLAALSRRPATAKDASDLPPRKRALTGRDGSGKSVFKSFDVTPKVVEVDSHPGLTFYDSAPGMHTTDTVDYCIVVRGEMTLELDDGEKVHLRQGDCVAQNGARHRWRNPLSEPCLMAFISVGGQCISMSSRKKHRGEGDRR